MHKIFSDISISAVSAAVPANKIQVRGLTGLFQSAEIDRIIQKTGIESFRRTDSETTAADLCYHAARALLADLGLGVGDIDGLVFVSAHPDFLSPPSSHILQHRLGLKTTTPCFDSAAGCSGYVQGILQSAMMISSGVSNRVLLLVGETSTKVLAQDDKTTIPLFGDAGSATIVEHSSGSSVTVSMYSDGSGALQIYLPNSGFRISEEPKFLKMNGMDVFAFAVKEGPASIRIFLSECGLNSEDIDVFVLHQANKLILDQILRKLGVNPDKALSSLKDFGNTGSASIPLSLVTDSGWRKRPKNKTLLSGFGVGLSWGVALADLSKTHIRPLLEV
jgi:3-oxoacyl-[acyl-carrier-protein] synthase-3